MLGLWQLLNNDNEDTAVLTDCDLSDLTDLDLDRQQADGVKSIHTYTPQIVTTLYLYIHSYIYIYIYLKT